MQTKLYKGTFYTVTDEAITPTGKVEHYYQPTRKLAIQAALYTHRLHNGGATASRHGVIHCPTCGQIVITGKE